MRLSSLGLPVHFLNVFHQIKAPLVDSTINQDVVECWQNRAVPLSSCGMDSEGRGRERRAIFDGGTVLVSAVHLPAVWRGSKDPQSGKKAAGPSCPDQVETQHLPVGHH